MHPERSHRAPGGAQGSLRPPHAQSVRRGGVGAVRGRRGAGRRAGQALPRIRGAPRRSCGRPAGAALRAARTFRRGGRLVEITADIPIVAVLAFAGLALLVYGLDRRRARLADRGHKAAIARHMNDLGEGVVTPVLLGVRDLDTYESDETIPERLSQHMARNYRRTESIIGAIEMHAAMCTRLSDRERADVETTVRFGRWLLDNYHPQDVREEVRFRVWTRHPSGRLMEKAREMHVCASRFAGGV